MSSLVDKVAAAIDASAIEAQANGNLFVKTGIPLVVLWDASPEIERLGPGVFSVGLWTPSSGRTAAEFALTNLRAKTAVLLCSEDEWSVSACAYFAGVFAPAGSIKETVLIGREERDFRTILLKVRSLRPDVVYVPLTDGIEAFYTQRLQLKLDVPLIGSDTITDDHLAAHPGLFEKVYQTQAPKAEGPRFARFLEEYRRKFSADPGKPLFSAWGYDAVHLIGGALRRAGANRAKTLLELSRVREFPGAVAGYQLNEKGSSMLSARMYYCREGRFTEVFPGLK